MKIYNKDIPRDNEVRKETIAEVMKIIDERLEVNYKWKDEAYNCDIEEEQHMASTAIKALSFVKQKIQELGDKLI